jgi:hypothetical protein
LKEKLETAKKTGNLEQHHWKEWKRTHRVKEEHLNEEKGAKLHNLLRETARAVMETEADVHKALQHLQLQQETMDREIEEHGWDKVQATLKANAGKSAFDKTGKMLTTQEIADRQLVMARKVLQHMEHARKAGSKKKKRTRKEVRDAGVKKAEETLKKVLRNKREARATALALEAGRG